MRVHTTGKPPNTRKDERLSLRIDAALRAQIRDEAAALGVSEGAAVRRILRRHFRPAERPFEEVLADLNRLFTEAEANAQELRPVDKPQGIRYRKSTL